MNIEFINVLWIFLISIGINYLFFIFAWILKSDVFTDLTYSLTFSIISIAFFIWKHNFSLFQILIFVLINLWAIRLGAFLFNRIIKTKKDPRFDNIRNSFWKFFGFWNLQAITIFIIILPSILFFIFKDNLFISKLTYISLIFIFISLLGLIIETLSDYQNAIFYNKKKKNDLDFLDKGLWKYSRHPNYFGEILFWYGICGCIIFTILINKTSSDSIFWVLALILSPLYINLNLLYLSGIRLSEKRRFVKYNTKQFYKYIINTSILIPFFGKKGPLNCLKKDFHNIKH